LALLFIQVKQAKTTYFERAYFVRIVTVMNSKLQAIIRMVYYKQENRQ
jgi:hypothetical protein